MLTPKIKHHKRRRWVGEVLLVLLMLSPLTLIAASRVKEVVIRYEDGTEQTFPAGVVSPEPDSEPTPPPVTPLPPIPNDSSNARPTVSLIGPADGTILAAPAYSLLHAQANDADGTIAKVEFYNGSTLLGTSYAVPHLVAWRAVPAGSYAITVKAIDDKGAETTSDVVQVTVVEPRPGRTLIAEAPGDFARLAPLLEAGDVLVVKPGTYAGPVRMTRSGTPDRPIVIRAEQSGMAVLQTSAGGPLFWADGSANVVVTGITFRGGGADNQNNHEASVRPGTGWRMEDCVVEKTLGVAVAAMKARDVVLLRVTAQDNPRAGIGGSSVDRMMVLDCISRRNNSKGDSNGGGGKFTRADTVLVQGHQSYDNTGVGIWFDYSNINIVVRGCEVHHNVDRYRADGGLKSGAAGIFFEISGIVEKNLRQGPLLAEGNYVHDNEREGIQAWGSVNVTIRDNTLVNDTIQLRGGRDEPFKPRNIRIVGNHLKDASIDADGDVAKRYRENSIVVDGNLYDRPGGGVFIRWGSTDCTTLDQARALGFDLTGRTGTVEAPASSR